MTDQIALDDATEWLEADGLGGFASGTTVGSGHGATTRCC